MENDIVAPQDGTVASINVTAGQSVESGASTCYNELMKLLRK